MDAGTLASPIFKAKSVTETARSSHWDWRLTGLAEWHGLLVERLFRA